MARPPNTLIAPLMALLAALLLSLVITGCNQVVLTSTHEPATFRADVAALIQERLYADATALLENADVEKQATHDRTGYAAVAGVGVYLPGVELSYDPQRDWLIPGTTDALEDDEQAAWQMAARGFATKYNQARQKLDQPMAF